VFLNVLQTLALCPVTWHSGISYSCFVLHEHAESCSPSNNPTHESCPICAFYSKQKIWSTYSEDPWSWG